MIPQLGQSRIWFRPVALPTSYHATYNDKVAFRGTGTIIPCHDMTQLYHAMKPRQATMPGNDA
eukprot:2748021-Lingulodinium_polyedra.AAC.1